MSIPDMGWTKLSITPDIARDPWLDVDGPDLRHGMAERVGLLRNGTADGNASVAILVRLDDGTPVLAQTTWRLFNAAARALAASLAVQEEA